MTDYLHSGANKMNKVEAYKNDNKLLLADKLGHAKVSSLKEQNLLNTIATVQQHSNKITQLEADANKVRGAYVYKGTVETEFDLPLNNNSVGDVYNTSSTGMNYAWNGENWDELGNSTVFALKVDGNIIEKVGTTLETPLNLQDCGICWGGNSQKFYSTASITKSFYSSSTDQAQLNNHIYTNTTQTFHYSGSQTLMAVGNGFGFSGSQAFNSPVIALYFGKPKAKLFKLGVQRQDTPSVITARTVGVLDGIELLLDSGHLLINQTKSINYIDSETKVKVIGTIQFGNYSNYSIPVTWDITLYGADALIPNYEQNQPEVNSKPILQLTTSLSNNSSYISEVDLSSFDQLQDVITLDTNIGNLTNLTTSDKTNIVTAINEIITTLNQQDFVDLTTEQSISGAKSFAEGPYGSIDLTDSSIIDLSNGCVFIRDIQSDTTFSFTGIPTGKVATFNLILTNGGEHTITWPASVMWANGIAPNLTGSGTNVLTFLGIDFEGTEFWYGTLTIANVPTGSNI